MAAYAGVYSKRVTPQSELIPGEDQVQNNAGGFVYRIDDWARLDRFLILGSSTNTYYQTAQKLSRENAEGVVRCLTRDGPRTVARIVEISDSGRAPKNDPAIFALAIAASLGDAVTKQAAFAALPKVCRIGTHLFAFCGYVHGLRGWGRGLRSALARWYLDKEPAKLAYQAVKYQSREGWSHRDVLRLAHAKPVSEDQKVILNWIVKGWPSIGSDPHPNDRVVLLWAFERAKRAENDAEIIELIHQYHLPREAVPTQFLTKPAVWEALLDGTPMTAMLRNLGTMSKVGLLTMGSNAERLVIENLRDTARIKEARVHPIAILSALTVYRQGHGERSEATWTACRRVVDALDDAFYASFQTVEPTGKSHLIALDVSGSMSSGIIAGVPGLTPRVASAALALVAMNVESQSDCIAFTWADNAVTPLTISPRQRLDDVLKIVDGLQMGVTDCALPMLWAIKQKISVDLFEVLTDNETWAGTIHPSQALRQYRQALGINARSVVVGMTATQFSIADPNDAGMMDVVGFDAAAPAIIADFARS